MNTVSTKPYLLRAIWEWCIDQGFTPHLAALVDENTRVPPGYARDGQIVLNLAPDATGQMQMANDFITFQARFGGVAHSLVIPVANVIALYAKENGQGMAFEPELVGEDAETGAEAESHDTPGQGPVAVEEMGAQSAPEQDDAGKATGAAPRRSRSSHLTVIK
ncbi:MAG TPA: ClpXP protease specificity-enhancing factor [Thauera sp.]|jgi:stringent starvation protein B|nr:ClpXP protease specificity-enhancing factor [Thauera sp.]HRA82026.1 ClpXP protease specificity-enhancing factor [Thauera sp.]